METLAVLDQVLAFFDEALNLALPILEGNVRFLFQSFLVITIVFAGATYAFGNTSVGVEFLLKKILLVGGTLFLITNWLDFTNVIVSSFGVLGLRVGGLSAVQLTTADLFSPARIAGIGFEYADDLLNRASEQAGYLGTGYLSGEGILLVIAALVMGLSFIIIALQVFMLLIEFKLVTLGAFILIPFAIMDRTTSLAQGALGYVIAAGLKIFVLAIVISLATAFVEPLTISQEVESSEAFAIMAIALTFVMLAIRAPGLAASISGAGPQIGVGAIAQTAATVATPVVAAGYAAGAGAKLTRAAVRVTGLGGNRTSDSGSGGGTGSSTAAKAGADVVGSTRTAVRAGATVIGTTAAAGQGGGGGNPSIDISSKS